MVERRFGWVPIVLALVGFALAARPAAPDPEEVKAKLGSIAWEDVVSEENITDGRSNWKGPSDLSFRYKIAARGGLIYLWVQVTDDKHVLGGASQPVGDHVELWLADAALAGRMDERQKSVGDTVTEFEVRLSDKECAEHVEGFLLEQKSLLASLQKERRCTHLWFEEGAKNAGGARPPGAAAPADYAYALNEGGYDFYMRLPLAGAFDVDTFPLQRFSFLVEVVDADEAGMPKPKSVASSVPGRRSDEPATFRTTDVNPPWEPGLPQCLETLLARQTGERMDPAGFWRASSGSYLPVMWTDNAWAGCSGADRMVYPGGPQNFPDGVPAPGGGPSVLIFGGSLVLRQGNACTAWDFGDLIHSSGEREWKVLLFAAAGKSSYLALNVSGPSRWPGGGTDCGSGTESDLIWLELQPGLTVRQSGGVHYESCIEGVQSEGLDVQADSVKVRYAPTRDSDPTTRQAVLDFKDPASGFVTNRVSQPSK